MVSNTSRLKAAGGSPLRTPDFLPLFSGYTGETTRTKICQTGSSGWRTFITGDSHDTLRATLHTLRLRFRKTTTMVRIVSRKEKVPWLLSTGRPNELLLLLGRFTLTERLCRRPASHQYFGRVTEAWGQIRSWLLFRKPSAGSALSWSFSIQGWTLIFEDAGLRSRSSVCRSKFQKNVIVLRD